MLTKYGIAIVAGAAMAIVSVTSSFALDASVLGDIAAAAQRDHDTRVIKQQQAAAAVGNAALFGSGSGRAADGAAGGARAVSGLSNMKFGCYKLFGC
jgi:hypothetical protein